MYDQIKEFQHQRLVNLSFANVNELIIPINLNGKHWILLIIEYLQISNTYYLYYFDSLGKHIPEPIIDALKNSKIIQDEVEIHSNFKQSLQTDDHNCGPWIITCATKWLESKQINIHDLLTIDIEHERMIQETYLEHLNHDVNTDNQ